MPRPLSICAITIALSAVLWPENALAIEGQHRLGLDPSLAMLKVDDKSTWSVGAGLALDYTYGINDQFQFIAEAGHAVVALHQNQDTPSSPRTRPATVTHATAGIGYVIDIIRWVPTIGILVGAYRFGGGTLDGALYLPGLELTAGVDYQLSREWAVGLAAREALFLTSSNYPFYITGMLRIVYSWGF
jgi:hypothetical protein